MSNELEGWGPEEAKSSKEADSHQSERIVSTLRTFFSEPHKEIAIEALIDELWREELERTRDDTFSWPPLRTISEINQELISNLRYACSHKWLLSKLASIEDKIKIYHVLHTEAPDISIPFAPGARPESKDSMSPHRFAFQGLDMLILTDQAVVSSSRGGTGKAYARNSNFNRYKKQLKAAFKAFVHGEDITDKCKISGMSVI